jgi:hypothetical protein
MSDGFMPATTRSAWTPWTANSSMIDSSSQAGPMTRTPLTERPQESAASSNTAMISWAPGAMASRNFM